MLVLGLLVLHSSLLWRSAQAYMHRRWLRCMGPSTYFRVLFSILLPPPFTFFFVLAARLSYWSQVWQAVNWMDFQGYYWGLGLVDFDAVDGASLLEFSAPDGGRRSSCLYYVNRSLYLKVS